MKVFIVYPGLGNRDYGRRDWSRWRRDILYPQNLALTSLTSGGRSVSIVRSRTQSTGYFFFRCVPFFSLPIVRRRRLALSTELNWRRRQNAVSETSCLKDRTMGNIQNCITLSLSLGHIVSYIDCSTNTCNADTHNCCTQRLMSGSPIL
jgi:hypothetical protein